MDDLVRVADVLFISTTYARFLTREKPLESFDPERFALDALKTISHRLKPGASGHFLLGSYGSVCFGKYDVPDPMTADELKHAGLDRFDNLSPTLIGNNILYGYFKIAALSQEDIEETCGEGDSCIAIVIWASLKKRCWSDSNRIGNAIGTEKCKTIGFQGLWTSDRAKQVLIM